MSTNYYTREHGDDDAPETHYGKRMGNVFSWAIHPSHALLIAPALGIVDEAGEPVSVDAFYALVKDLTWRTELVGGRFC